MTTAYVTAPPDAAADLARTVVEERLAACVNRVECESTYRWDDEIVEEREVILLMKTTDERYDDLVARVVDRHPYDVPCVERFDSTETPDDFAAWVAASTTPEYRVRPRRRPAARSTRRPAVPA